MSSPLSEATLQIIEATAPVVAQHVDQIVPAMYRRLLADEEIRALFNMSNQEGQAPQHKALANALVAYATHIRTPNVLAEAVERIAQKHAGLQILPEHYPHVADALLGAISEVLGEAATPEILSAWGEAYWQLAHILIGREEDIYQGTAEASGGWRGWRSFEIAEKRREATDIVSFVLRPVDGGAVVQHLPGQYLSFRFHLADGEEQRRNYSISSAPNGQIYRITVKREPHGRVSNWLHEVAEVGQRIEVAPPAGDFFLDPRDKREVVLLSGGVGLTPMISMLEACGGKGLRMIHVHAAQDPERHAMTGISGRLADATFAFYEDLGGRERKEGVLEGRIDPAWLTENTDIEQADYFICGPVGFMQAMVRGLKAANVPNARIHHEFFGPAAEVLG